MALGFPKPIRPDDPRLKGNETTYSSSRGGWVKTPKKPTPGTPSKG
ncbi:hypothetical protein ACIGZH_01730 [Streptomyces sp. NPDC058319]